MFFCLKSWERMDSFTRGPVTVQLSPLPPLYRKYDTKVSPNSSSVLLSLLIEKYTVISYVKISLRLASSPLPLLGLEPHFGKKYTSFIERCVLFVENNYTFEFHVLRVCPCPGKSCKKWDLAISFSCFFFFFSISRYCEFRGKERKQGQNQGGGQRTTRTNAAPHRT